MEGMHSCWPAGRGIRSSTVRPYLSQRQEGGRGESEQQARRRRAVRSHRSSPVSDSSPLVAGEPESMSLSLLASYSVASSIFPYSI
jgi:hypothetical protein